MQNCDGYELQIAKIAKLFQTLPQVTSFLGYPQMKKMLFQQNQLKKVINGQSK